MKNICLINLFVVVFFVSGCSSIKVNSDYNPDVSFAGFQFYNWIPYAPSTNGDPRIDGNTLFHDRVRHAIDEQLAAKGYVKSKTEKPDFWVTYHFTLDKQTEIQTINNNYNYGPGWGWGYRDYYSPFYGSDTYIYTYEQGTLIVDIVDPNNRKLVWRGTVIDKVNFFNTPEQKKQKIREAVTKLLMQFPPLPPQ